MIYFPKLKFSYLPSICRQCGREKYWIKNKSKDNIMEMWNAGGSGSSFHHGLFVTSFPTLLNRPGCPGCFSAHKYRGWGRAHLPKTLVFTFQLLSRSWKASTFNQEPSEFPWKVTYLYLPLTLSAAKLLGFEGSLLPLLTHLSVPDLLDPYKTRLERNLKNAGQDEDHFAALPWSLSSWPGTSDSLEGSAS